MKKVLKFLFIFIIIIIALILLLLLAGYMNHQIQLSKENKRFTPPGQMVEVNDHRMHVYSERNGEKTLVFMSGGGTSSPVLDFKSLYSLLNDVYKIVVVEKAGLRFSPHLTSASLYLRWGNILLIFFFLLKYSIFFFKTM